MLIYVCQDGVNPSGVSTYGYHFLRNFPDAKMLLLNANCFPEAAPKPLRRRMVLLPEKDSHSPSRVAGKLAQMVKNISGRVVILPNTGDTSWAATAEFLRGANKRTTARVRILGIIHGDLDTQYTLAENYWPIAPLWIAVSRRCADEVSRRVLSHGVKVRVLSSPVEIPPLVPAHGASGVLKIAYVGRIEEPQKRVSRLVEIFARLMTRGVKFTATVAGDGPAISDFRKKISGARLGRIVKITGALSRYQINKVWATHHLFVLTSAYEGLPLALLEAMAWGLCPVVMAVKSGLPELLTDGHNSRVVPQGKSSRMADVIATLANDRDEIKRLGSVARQDVAERFSQKTHMDAFKSIIREINLCKPPEVERVKPDETSICVERIAKRLSKADRSIVVYGSGMFGRKVVDRCLALKLKVVAMIDSDPARKGSVYRGIKCFGIDNIADFKDAVFAVGSLQFVDPILKNIQGAFKARKLKKPVILSALP